MFVMSSNVCNKISWPTSELLDDELNESVNWGLFGQLVQLVQELALASSKFTPSGGNKDHIPLHVASSFMVLAMGDLP
jgi:hypothetical protein